MSLELKLRTGKDPLSRTLRGAARRAMRFHVPVGGPLRPLFRFLFRVHTGARDLAIWLVRFCWSEPLFRGQCEAVGPGFYMEKLPDVFGHGRIRVGSGVRISGKLAFQFSNRVNREPSVTIGDGTFIGHGCVFHVAGAIRIGNHCYLARGSEVSDFDGHSLDADARRENAAYPAHSVRPVTIGNDVWVGARATILKGVTIGDRSIVGASAVVTRDVPPDVVVAGNPARIVKHLKD